LSLADVESFATHLLAVDTPLVGLDHNVAVAGDVEAGALALLDVALVVVCGNNLFHLGGLDGEAGACGPDAVAGAAEDGGLVDVVGANEAVRESVSVLLVRLVRMRGGEGYLVSTYAARHYR